MIFDHQKQKGTRESRDDKSDKKTSGNTTKTPESRTTEDLTWDCVTREFSQTNKNIRPDRRIFCKTTVYSIVGKAVTG